MGEAPARGGAAVSIGALGSGCLRGRRPGSPAQPATWGFPATQFQLWGQVAAETRGTSPGPTQPGWH